MNMEISICTNTFVNCARISVSSFHSKFRSFRLLSSLLKSFSGKFCSDIESIATTLSVAWNKTNSSTPIFRFLGDFAGIVGVL